MSHLEDEFLDQIRHAGLPEPTLQYAFHPGRKWRFDFAWPGERLAVEINGGTWNGGHSQGRAVSREYEKLNAACLWHWRVLLVDTVMVKEGLGIETLRGALLLPSYVAACRLPKKENAKRKKL